MPAPKVYIRCDSSNLIGSGHVIRNLALAETLKAHGHSIEFWCKDLPGALSEQITSQGYPLSWIPADLTEEQDALFCKALVTDRSAWIVVDHYQLAKAWESHFYGRNFLVVIDDLASRPHFCDVIIDTNYYSDPNPRYEKLLLRSTTRLLGPQHSLLRNEFRDIDTHAPIKRSGLLVFFGGHDSKKETGRFITAACEYAPAGMNVKILTSHNNVELPKLLAEKLPANFELIVQPPSLSQLFQKSQFYFGSGGTITWERMRCGLVGAVATVADNQVSSTEELAKNGFQYYLGPIESVDYSKLFSQLESYMKNNSALEQMRKLGQSLVRPLEYKNLESATNSARLRLADISDAQFLFDLRTDPKVNAASQSKAAFSYQDHVAWLQKVLNQNIICLFIVLYQNQNAGQVRIDADGTMSISLAENARGQGLATPALRLALDYAEKMKGQKNFKAIIHADNVASQKSFISAGFSLSKSQPKSPDGFEMYHYSV